MFLYTLLTIYIGKIVIFCLKLFKRGSGTALPGLIIEKINPGILNQLASQFAVKILITGTNGKTTTQKLIVDTLKQERINVISNGSGSNMQRGLISKLVSKASLTGKFNAKTLVFEVEEATMPKVVKKISPTHIIVTNLYRDQLDAYGEVDRTEKFIREAIEAIPDAKVILNFDDPRVSRLTEGLANRTYYYSIDSEFKEDFKYEGIIESKRNVENSINLTTANNIEFTNDLKSKYQVQGEQFMLNLYGIYQVYNSLASLIVLKSLNISEESIRKSFELSQPAFGRGELIMKDSLRYQFLLVKNPAGMNLTLKMLSRIKRANIALVLNDKQADGKDVSWIWDSNFEFLTINPPQTIFCAGSRAADMLLRVKYSFGPLIKLDKSLYSTKNGSTKIFLIDEIKDFHNVIHENLDAKSLVYILPTYTAMLETRSVLISKDIEDEQ